MAARLGMIDLHGWSWYCMQVYLYGRSRLLIVRICYYDNVGVCLLLCLLTLELCYVRCGFLCLLSGWLFLACYNVDSCISRCWLLQRALMMALGLLGCYVWCWLLASDRGFNLPGSACRLKTPRGRAFFSLTLFLYIKPYPPYSS